MLYHLFYQRHCERWFTGWYSEKNVIKYNYFNRLFPTVAILWVLISLHILHQILHTQLCTSRSAPRNFSVAHQRGYPSNNNLSCHLVGPVMSNWILQNKNILTSNIDHWAIGVIYSMKMDRAILMLANHKYCKKGSQNSKKREFLDVVQ